MWMKKIEAAVLMGLCLTILAGFTYQKEQTEIADRLVRLHVIANSDYADDQQLKLLVRDRVTESVGKLLEGESSICSAIPVLERSLSKIQADAVQIVRENGYSYPVRVELVQESYNTREYETFTLPAGTYQSLRVILGKGQGKNWWCVVFPPLCFASSEEFIDAAEAAGLSKGSIKLITERNEGVILRFKFLEILREIQARFNR